MDILTHILDTIDAEYPGAVTDRMRLERIIRLNFGSDRHYIASADAMSRAARDARIAELLAQGLNSEEVAARVGLTGARVRQIRADRINRT
ncbi:MAG TPA: hypothetical protein PK620_11955 [Denitromonas sp.]|nr:hypothetical protein [Zoogloeaceae bacterium]HQU89422.1 hypothetical protein [Denitromonas sp.]HQV15623.1 hypothetical protein [Denitromonas sp.]